MGEVNIEGGDAKKEAPVDSSILLKPVEKEEGLSVDNKNTSSNEEKSDLASSAGISEVSSKDDLASSAGISEVSSKDNLASSVEMGEVSSKDDLASSYGISEQASKDDLASSYGISEQASKDDLASSAGISEQASKDDLASSAGISEVSSKDDLASSAGISEVSSKDDLVKGDELIDPEKVKADVLPADSSVSVLTSTEEKETILSTDNKDDPVSVDKTGESSGGEKLIADDASAYNKSIAEIVETVTNYFGPSDTSFLSVIKQFTGNELAVFKKALEYDNKDLFISCAKNTIFYHLKEIFAEKDELTRKQKIDNFLRICEKIIDRIEFEKMVRSEKDDFLKDISLIGASISKIQNEVKSFQTLISDGNHIDELTENLNALKESIVDMRTKCSSITKEPTVLISEAERMQKLRADINEPLYSSKLPQEIREELLKDISSILTATVNQEQLVEQPNSKRLFFTKNLEDFFKNMFERHTDPFIWEYLTDEGKQEALSDDMRRLGNCSVTMAWVMRFCMEHLQYLSAEQAEHIYGYLDNLNHEVVRALDMTEDMISSFKDGFKESAAMVLGIDDIIPEKGTFFSKLFKQSSKEEKRSGSSSRINLQHILHAIDSFCHEVSDASTALIDKTVADEILKKMSNENIYNLTGYEGHVITVIIEGDYVIVTNTNGFQPNVARTLDFQATEKNYQRSNITTSILFKVNSTDDSVRENLAAMKNAHKTLKTEEEFNTLLLRLATKNNMIATDEGQQKEQWRGSCAMSSQVHCLPLWYALNKAKRDIPEDGAHTISAMKEHVKSNLSQGLRFKRKISTKMRSSLIDSMLGNLKKEVSCSNIKHINTILDTLISYLENRIQKRLKYKESYEDRRSGVSGGTDWKEHYNVEYVIRGILDSFVKQDKTSETMKALDKYRERILKMIKSLDSNYTGKKQTNICDLLVELARKIDLLQIMNKEQPRPSMLSGFNISKANSTIKPPAITPDKTDTSHTSPSDR